MAQQDPKTKDIEMLLKRFLRGSISTSSASIEAVRRRSTLVWSSMMLNGRPAEV